ncbi:MAG: ATP-binding cassette domain-containing protein [Planctomycetaceae bacterium]|nr:ATP-binding cassette domain-containing protein [Planctomycetaceae bacterium]
MNSLTTPILELRHVSRQFGTQHVLRDISLAVHPGETLVIIGESGCGKSVTMKLLMALLKPTSGEVLWNGNPVQQLNEREISTRRLKYGYLFQGAALFDSMNVFENVAFGLRQNTNLKEDQILDIVVQRLHEVGLSEDVCGKKPAELSGGMKKRVGLARALALDPRVMFFDEPTTGLDPIMSDVINELIFRTGQRDVTNVVVTHDMRTVERIADKVIMFFPLARLDDHQEQIIFRGTKDELFACEETQVSQFVRGEAGARIEELHAA